MMSLSKAHRSSATRLTAYLGEKQVWAAVSRPVGRSPAAMSAWKSWCVCSKVYYRQVKDMAECPSWTPCRRA